jgi:hypothetical protein
MEVYVRIREYVGELIDWSLEDTEHFSAENTCKDKDYDNVGHKEQI